MRVAAAHHWLGRACSYARRALAGAGCALRTVLGVPDYERYLAHARELHPGARPLSRDEFVAARLRARYERPGARCC